MAQKYNDEYFLGQMAEELKENSKCGEDYCVFYGAYTDYNGLDVQNLINPIFGK